MQQSRVIHIFFVITGVVVASACSKDFCLLSTGTITKESRSLASFKEVKLYNRINLIITQDTVQATTVEAGQHLLADIETTVANNVLTIRNKNKCNWARDLNPSINVYISTKQLEKISYYGAGNITSANTLIADQFTVDSWTGIGSIKLNLTASNTQAIVRQDNADITLTGKSTNTYVYCAQEGSVDVRNLVSETALIESKSINDVYVNVTKFLTARILYKGNVYYRGNPGRVDTLRSSTGQLIHIP